MNSQNPPPHAELQIRVERHTIGLGASAIVANIKGCKDCLQASITALLLSNQEFKELINRSVRAANEIKGRTQN